MAVNPLTNYLILDLKGPTLDEYMKNPNAYILDYDRREAQNEETRNSLAGIISMLDPNDPKSLASLNILNNVKQNVDLAANHLSQFGLDTYTKSLINDARVNANLHVPRISKAILDMDKINQSLFDEKMQHPGVEYNATDAEGQTFGIDDLLYNKKPSIWRVDTNDLYKKCKEGAENLSTRLSMDFARDMGKTYYSTLSGIYELVHQQGFKLLAPDELLDTLFNKFPVLRNAAEQMLPMTNYEHMTTEQKRMIAQTCLNGIYAGLRFNQSSQVIKSPELAYSGALDKQGFAQYLLYYSEDQKDMATRSLQKGYKAEFQSAADGLDHAKTELVNAGYKIDGVFDSTHGDYFDLLALAITKPEIFDKVVELVDDAKSDKRFLRPGYTPNDPAKVNNDLVVKWFNDWIAGNRIENIKEYKKRYIEQLGLEGVGADLANFDTSQLSDLLRKRFQALGESSVPENLMITDNYKDSSERQAAYQTALRNAFLQTDKDNNYMYIYEYNGDDGTPTKDKIRVADINSENLENISCCTEFIEHLMNGIMVFKCYPKNNTKPKYFYLNIEDMRNWMRADSGYYDNAMAFYNNAKELYNAYLQHDENWNIDGYSLSDRFNWSLINFFRTFMTQGVNIAQLMSTTGSKGEPRPMAVPKSRSEYDNGSSNQ